MRTDSHHAFRAILDLLSFYLLHKKVLHSPSLTSNHSYDALGFKKPTHDDASTSGQPSAGVVMWQGKPIPVREQSSR